MQFLPETKGKKILHLLLLLGAVGGIVYFNFFVKVGAPRGLPPAAVLDKGLLPFGDKIDTGFLENEKFKALRSVPSLEVRDDELGKLNPFGQ